MYAFYKPQKHVDIPKLKLLTQTYDEFDYLGLLLNKHLSLKNHVIRITNKIFKTIGIINQLNINFLIIISSKLQKKVFRIFSNAIVFTLRSYLKKNLEH